MELVHKKLQDNLLAFAQRTSFSTEMERQNSKHPRNLAENCVSRTHPEKADKPDFKDREAIQHLQMVLK